MGNLNPTFHPIPSSHPIMTDRRNSQPVVEAMHQGAASGDVDQRQLLQKKLSGAANGGGGTTFASPTDTLMSPCTAKLNAQKRKHFNKHKPVSFGAIALHGGSSLAKENSFVEGEQPFMSQGVKGWQ